MSGSKRDLLGGGGGGGGEEGGTRISLCPSFIYAYLKLNFSSYLGCPSTTFSLAPVVYSAAGHCAKLNASCLRKGFFTLRKFAPAVEGLPYLHLTTGS